MEKVKKIDVIGGGPVGLLFALFNASKNLSICIHERLSKNDLTIQNKALALSHSTIDVLNKFDIKPNQATGFIPISKIHTSQKGSFGRAILSLNENTPIGFVIKYGDLVSALLEKVCKNSFIELSFSKEIKKVNFSSNNFEDNDGHKNNYDFIVFSDGIGNLLTDKFTFHTHDDFDNLFGLVAEVDSELNHNNVAYERFTPDGPMALLPIDDYRKSTLIWTGEKKKVDRLLALGDTEFKYMFLKNFGERLGSLKLVNHKKIFPLRHQYLNSTALENILVLGNAAHSMHPVAGQGFNLTVRDLNSFNMILEGNKLLLDDQVLNLYQDARRKEMISLMQITSGLVKGFSNNYFGINKLRSIGLNLLDNNAFLKKEFISRFSYGKD